MIRVGHGSEERHLSRGCAIVHIRYPEAEELISDYHQEHRYRSRSRPLSMVIENKPIWGDDRFGVPGAPDPDNTGEGLA